MSNILEMSCPDCDEFDYEDIYEEFENLYDNNFEELMYKNVNDENFLHLLVWNPRGENVDEQVDVCKRVIEKMSIDKLDVFLSKTQDGETPLHYLLDEKNKLDNESKLEIIKTILDKYPLDRKLDFLSMKEDNTINITSDVENIAVWIAEIDEDFFAEKIFNFNELNEMNEIEYNKMFEMLCCCDDEGESLFQTITDLNLDTNKDIVKIYCETIFEELNNGVDRVF